MEVFGGFMVMMSIISLFLAVVWLIMPFVVFAIKGKQDRTLEVLEAIEVRMAALEAALKSCEAGYNQAGATGSLSEAPLEDVETSSESVDEKNNRGASPVV
ncbi:MAG: hypothetical protein ACYDHC_03080 [Desulfuromonadaceae bacterium]